MKILKTAQDTFVWAKKGLPVSCELEVYLSSGRGRKVAWSEKQCEDIHQAEGGGAGLRVILKGTGGGRQGYAFTTDLSRDGVEKIAERALEAARRLPEDEFRKLPSASIINNVKEDALFDPSTFGEALPMILERLRSGEDRLLTTYPQLKSVLRASFSEGISETAIVSSAGVERAYAGTYQGLGVSCLAEKDGERQEGGFGQSKRFRKDLDWDFTFNQGAERTLALLGGRAIPTGTVAVVFDPSVAGEFLSLFSGAVSADAVQKGKSFLGGKLGQPVASPLVTLVDDGALAGGLATSPVDDEGVPTRRTPVISSGTLEHYLYDTYTALKDKTVSTGNAGRSGFKSSPSCDASNFYMEAGTTSRQSLLNGTRGLYLYEAMGLHMADPVSGDFSVAAIGAWLENGEFKHGVRGVTLAGNLLDLMKSVDAVADDLTFFGSIGSPTFRVASLQVSGS